MFLQYTKYRGIDAVTWHDACHVTKSPRLSAFPSGGSTVKRGIIARRRRESLGTRLARGRPEMIRHVRVGQQ